jgi:hypothetical protein
VKMNDQMMKRKIFDSENERSDDEEEEDGDDGDAANDEAGSD